MEGLDVTPGPAEIIPEEHKRPASGKERERNSERVQGYDAVTADLDWVEKRVRVPVHAVTAKHNVA